MVIKILKNGGVLFMGDKTLSK
ncbi:hypothetical protein SFB1_241G1, partial [Candidatus Arthromitus sp. SFB-1]